MKAVSDRVEFDRRTDGRALMRKGIAKSHRSTCWNRLILFEDFIFHILCDYVAHLGWTGPKINSLKGPVMRVAT